MRHKTDYSQIADTYDQGHKRKAIPVSETLASRAGAGAAPRVLDVACGTGNWLEVQHRAFAKAGVRFHGIDASEAMLAQARAKLPKDVELTVGAAERLPHDSAAFDLVVCNFAFHHFEDKDAALDQLARVRAADGALELWNICPEHMPRWWIYRYFPAARAVDQERFWTTQQLWDGLHQRSLSPTLETRVFLQSTPSGELLAEARRRDVSQLALLDDADYEAGVRSMERDADRAPTMVDQVALLTARAG